jgi:hypothetical protein
MNDNDLNMNTVYILSFFISVFILSLINSDLKKFKIKLYNEIDTKIWLKIYAIISIAFIHIFWLLNVLFIDMKDKSLIYGFPFYLLISYLLYIVTDLKNNEDKDLTIASDKINKYLNILMSIYFVVVILIIIIPNELKIQFIKFIKSIIFCILHYIDNYIHH